MKKPTSILVIIERGTTPHHALDKGLALARRFGARVELFLCDAEHAYALRHAYDSRGVAEARAACIADGRELLATLRGTIASPGVDIGIDAACESPLHEGIVHKVLRGRHDMVVKSMEGFLTAADWHLIRTCPVPLMLARENAWHAPLRLAAAVDVNGDDAEEVARSVVHAGECVSLACRGRLEILHGARAGAPESTRAALQQLASQFQLAPKDVHLLEGEPEHTLPQFARERGYDLVVMGALSRRGALTALVGTLTSRLVDGLACDMLFIKPTAFACTLDEDRSPAGMGIAPAAAPKAVSA